MKSCSRKDQAHLFVEKVEECDEGSFMWVLEVLKKTSFPHIAEKLKESYQKYVPLQSSYSYCLICRIQREVNIKSIRSGLKYSRLLPYSLYKDINRVKTSEGHQNGLWQELFSYLKSLEPKKEIAIKFAMVFNIPKHKSLYSALLKKPLSKYYCTCKIRHNLESTKLTNQNRPRLITSDSGEESDTSFEEYHRDPEWFEDVMNSTCNSTESEHIRLDFNTGKSKLESVSNFNGNEHTS